MNRSLPCFFLALALAACGNKGPLVQADAPPPVDPPAASVPIDTPVASEGQPSPTDNATLPAAPLPADTSPVADPEPEPAEPATPPAGDDGDG